MGVICNKTNNKSKITNTNNNNKIIQISNNQETKILNPKEENSQKEEKKIIETITLKNNYHPKIYGEDKLNNFNKENNILYNSIKQSTKFIRKESKRITVQKKQTVKFLKDFKKNFEVQNQNYLLRHLVRKLTNNINNNNLEDNLKKKADFPEFMINYKLVKLENSENYTWKNLGLIKINQDLISEIMSMSIEEAKNCKFLYKKRIWLHCFLHQNVIDNKKDNPILLIHRNNILIDSFNEFRKNDINLKQVININFIDEVNNIKYEGGTYREWYSDLFKEFFKEKNDLFIQNENNTAYNGTFIINQLCEESKFNYYEFFGKLLIKAIMDNVHMKEHLNITLIKYILNIEVDLEDMKFFDLSLYKSLKKINEEKIENNENLKELNFTYNLKNLNGTINKIDLIPGGDKVYLNDNNKKILIEKIIYYETYYKYKEQIEKIKKGFYNIIDDIIGKFYTAQEFDFEIVGMKIIDLNDWKLNTIYKGHFNNENETIKIFWEVLNNLNQNELMTFFEFCTGLCNVPVDGFGSLKGIGNKIMKFTIEPLMSEFNLNDNPNQFKLIQAKACFNRILLPEYKNKKDMEKAIKIIIENDTSFFGIE